jgi:dipeptidyl aminopeptidase/acylaminoacyl peptidase
MSDRQVAPYGSWRSPITADMVARGGVRLGQIVLDGDDIYWNEGRPNEGGRNVIVRRTADGNTSDLTPVPMNARTRVHEYGGGAFTVDRGTVYFSNFADGRLYRQEPTAEPVPITPAASLYYADLVADRRRQRLVCVREDHTQPGREAVNTLVAAPQTGDGEATILISGSDFYSTPRLSPDGGRLSWLSWNHPNLPWDGTELWTAEVAANGDLGPPRLVAGGRTESVFDPKWSPDGRLYFVSDRSGWWNLYRQSGERIDHLAPMEAEFGVPQWVFALSTYAFVSADRLLCSIVVQGQTRLVSLELESGASRPIPLAYTEIGADLHVHENQLIFDAGSPTLPTSLLRLDLQTSAIEVLRESRQLSVDATYLAIPEAIEFPTEGGLTAHAWFYFPANPVYVAPAGELPPLLVHSHGGPTSAAGASLSLGIQYWTSRGIAVLDVNYGGSSGYGRAYRRRLEGQWGVVDVDDCVNGARYLVQRGLVDGERLMISGGSAGGYTTLCALTFRDVFKAGASHFGIGDLEAFVDDTHKFESRYLDRLVGPYPERRDLYHERSAINYTDRLSCPVILLQGLEDKIVPPNQAEMMVAALLNKGLPVAYVAFEGEQHGFRKAENIARALEAELYFYARVFRFPLADPIEPVDIANLPA